LSGSSAIEVVGQSDIGSIRRDPLGNLIDITLEQFKLGDKARRGLKAKHNPIHSGPAIQLMWNNQILMPWLVEESMKGDDCEADCVQKLNALEINDLDHEIKELLAAGEREAAISLLSEYETDVRITPYQSNMIFGNRTGEIVLNMTSQENPDSLEQYVIEGVVAQGGMGMIFRAQRYTRRKDSTADSFEDQGSVVIKVLLPRKADTYLEDRKNLSQSFSNFEAAILRNKDNPSIEEWMRLYKSHKAPKLSKDLKAYAANTKRSNEFKAIRQSHAATLGVLEKSGAFNKGLNLPLFIDSLIQFIEVSKEFLNALNDIEKRFEREIRVVSQLEHDHIAQAINWGMITGKQGEAVSVKINHTNRDGSVREATEPEEIVFMVLEDAGKTNLSALLRSYGGMPWERARQITLKIAHALAYAHSQGKVHRDVKAGNVTIDETGEPKLVDFGIAGIIESASGTLTNAAGTITRDGVAIGSLDSMDTGQATDTKQVNAQNDMGALGKLLYHLITGSFDHPGRNRQERFLQRYSDNRPVNVYHLPGDYILPTKLKKLNKIINKLLKRENHTGYRNMFEVINALATIGYEEAKPAGPVEIRPDGGEDSILPDIPKEFLRELSGSAFFKTVDIEGITFKPYTNGRVQATFYMRNKVKSTSVVISKAISDKGEWLLETRTLKKAFFHKRDMEEAWKAKPIVSDLDNADTVLTQNILTWLSIIPIGAVISTTINFIIPQGFLWWVGGALITTLFTVPIAYFLVAHAYAHNWFNLRRDLPMTSQIEANCIDCAGAEGFTESHSLLWESVNQKDSYFRKIGARSIMIKTTEYEVTTDDEGAASGRVVIKGEVRIDSKLWGTQYFPIKQGVFDFATGEEAPFRMNITDKVIKDWIKQSRQQGARMGQRLNRRKFLEQGLLASLVALPIGYFSAPELREELFPVDTSEDIPFAFPPAIDDVAWMEAESSDNREGFAKVLDATITWLEQHNVYPDHLEAFKKLQEIASDESRIEIVTDKEMPDNIFRVQLHGSVRIDGALIGWTAETPHLVVNASKFDELFKLIQEKGSRELFLKLFALPLMAQTTKLSLEPGARAKLHAEARNSYKFEQEYGKKQKMPKDPKLGRLHHRLLYGPENDDKITKSAAYLFLPELYSARVLNDLLRRSEVYEGISLIDADENVVANLTEGVLKERWDYVQSQSVDQTAKVDQLLPIFITTLLDQRGLYLNHPRYGNAIYRSWIRSILARYLNQGYFPSYILQPAHQNEYIKKGPLAYPKDVYNKLLRRMLLISEDVAKELKFEKFMPDIIFNPPLPPEEADRAAAAEAKATDVEAEKESEDSKQEEAKKTTGGARLTVGDIDVFANAGLREVDSDNLLGRLSVDAVVRDGFKRLSLKPSTRDARVPIVFNQEEGWFDTLRVSDFADMDLRTDSLEVSDKSFGLGLSDGNRALDQLEEALRLLMGFVNRGLSPKIVAFVQSDLESSPRSETAIMNIRNSIVEGRWSSAVQTVTLSEDASGQDVLGIDGLLSLMSRSTTKTRLVLIAHPESINSITRRPEMAALISAGRMSVVPIGAPTLDAYSTSPWSLSVVTGLLMDEIARMDSVQRMRYLLDHWKVFKKMGLNFKAAEDVLIMAIFDELLSLKRLTQYAIKAIPLSPQIFRMLLNRTQVRMSA
jgi:serine/threonine protein kinase